MNYTRKIDYDDYENDTQELIPNNSDIRYCSCGRIMHKVISHEEISGFWVPIERWECQVCD